MRLSGQAVAEYALCNEAYQHTALDHTERCLRSPASNPQIQKASKESLNAQGVSARLMDYLAIVVCTSLFTVGCEALRQDKILMKQQLRQQYDLLKIQNIKLTIHVLGAFWADKNEGFLRMHHTLCF